MRYETWVVGIGYIATNGYRHKLSIATIGLHVALSYLHKPKLWRQAGVATGKNVATACMVVAIERFIATIPFSWQYPITMRFFATLANESHFVAIGTYCHKSTHIATIFVVAIDPGWPADRLQLLGLIRSRPTRIVRLLSGREIGRGGKAHFTSERAGAEEHE